jgi:hypothetical protein
MGIIDYENLQSAHRELNALEMVVIQARRPVFANPYMDDREIVNEARYLTELSIAKDAGKPPVGEHINISWRWSFAKDRKPKRVKANKD